MWAVRDSDWAVRDSTIRGFSEVFKSCVSEEGVKHDVMSQSGVISGEFGMCLGPLFIMLR